MAKRSVSPIKTWFFWSILVLGAFSAVTWQYFWAGFSADSSHITKVMLGFFIYGFASSLRVALHLEAEFKSLKQMDEDQRVGDPNASDAAAMFDSALERIRRGDRIEVRNLITAYGVKLKGRVDNIGVVSGMLVTIGLLGTVIGLIIAVTGLGLVLQSGTGDFAAMREGLKQSFSGMGTAFYTTFIGALLGGVVLKVLSAEMKKSAQILVADALRFSELFVAPQFERKATGVLAELEQRIQGLDEQLDSLGTSFGGIIETIDSKQTVLSEGLTGLAHVVSQTSAQAEDRTEKLVAAIAETLSQTTRQADDRLSAFTASLQQFNAESSERASALVDSIARMIEGTTRQADDRLSAITSTLNQTGALADERLATITAALEQTQTETAARATALTAAISESIESANQRADERLSLSSDALGKSVDETTRQTADRMNTLLERMGEMMEQTDLRAGERLEVLTTTIGKSTEETNRMADERLQVMARAIEATSQATHAKADAQLADLVQHVESAMQNSRKEAEERLNTRASELAGKLSEAASMLAGLVNVPSSNPMSDEG